ncbi:LysR family transcriptional regulator [Saccharothrix violaceirubra]|uniref:DNA-binding transcriptional LysR family regulator n=1 Tax=Saccharothrix violaceirubra TaxID=413306 RepID=A0A7W7TA13_9PSEU|nr:LysR family transcriptional regulator [Saccharothrix violaceirubra]MBB4969294.1 DNA-binding transcriptional LysR family regulator [Saccharothrix violaceirubra]
MDLDGVRTFVAVVDGGRFQEAADELSISQQAVSKRVAALERTLGVRLFTRTPRGAVLTADGLAFLPHARDLVAAVARAWGAVRPVRALRVDVIGTRLAPAALVREFHRAHPSVALDVVTHFDLDAAVAALRSGSVDASVRAADRLPDGIEAVRVFDEPIQLLVGPGHPLADEPWVRPADLAGHRLWMPGLVAGTEWAAFYDAFAAEFGVTIESAGPHFGIETLSVALAARPGTATLVGEWTRIDDRGLRRIALREPTPVYPHSLLWHRDNRHPALTTLRSHFIKSEHTYQVLQATK